MESKGAITPQSTALEAALTPGSRDDLEQGTNSVYAAGCVCSDGREHQQRLDRISIAKVRDERDVEGEWQRDQKEDHELDPALSKIAGRDA